MSKFIKLEGDDRQFSLDRDLAYLGPQLIASGLLDLHSSKSIVCDPWIRRFVEEHRLDPEEMDDAIRKFLEVIESVLTEPDQTAAIERTGFDQIRPEIQLLLYAKLGQMLLAGYYSAVKESTLKESHIPKTVQGLVKDAEAVAQRFRLVHPAASEPEDHTTGGCSGRRTLWERIRSVLYAP